MTKYTVELRYDDNEFCRFVECSSLSSAEDISMRHVADTGDVARSALIYEGESSYPIRVYRWALEIE